MRADITCPLWTITGFTAVTERRKQNQHSRRRAHKTEPAFPQTGTQNSVRNRLRRSAAAFWISNFLEQGFIRKFVVPQLANNFPTFYVTRRFITAFTTIRHLPLSLAKPIRSAPPKLSPYIFHRLCHFKGPIQVLELVSVFQYDVFR
jgi:hypothetical protein